MSKKRLGILFVGGVTILSIAAALYLYFYRHAYSDSNDTIHEWFTNPAERARLITEYDEPCPGAPFLLPSAGLIGLLWRDAAAPYNVLQRHTGIDIFGDGQPDTVPVVAAYDGYLTRLDDWFATVIIRHDDPLQPGRTIWTYYTHIGNRSGTVSYIAEAFPPGTQDVWVEQGTLLGYQGEYNGDSYGIALHLHFSIVTSDAAGMFKNEAVLGNTLNPSPYLGLTLNMDDHPERPIRCGQG